jgi:hypothetical protein
VNRIHVETVVETDGELHLSNLPCRKGDRVEAVLFVPDQTSAEKRRQAKERFLERARSSKFRSESPYPSRDELHGRA